MQLNVYIQDIVYALHSKKWRKFQKNASPCDAKTKLLNAYDKSKSSQVSLTVVQGKWWF